MPNIFDPHFDELREWPGFQARRARIGHQLATRSLGVSLWELPPGQTAYPYHQHLVEEELVVVLEGAPHLRTPDGWRELATGEVVSFPAGEGGAHQVANFGDVPVRFLAVSTHGQPDVVLYPDAGKIGVLERLPRGGGLSKFFRAGDDVGYMEGERPPARPDA